MVMHGFVTVIGHKKEVVSHNFKLLDYLEGQGCAEIEPFGEVNFLVALQLLVAFQEAVGLLHLAVLPARLSLR